MKFNWSWENNPNSTQGTMTLESSDHKLKLVMSSFSQAFALAQLIGDVSVESAEDMRDRILHSCSAAIQSTSVVGCATDQPPQDSIHLTYWR